MAAFTYSAINSTGLELSGELHAPDLAGAREQLRIRGLLANKQMEVYRGIKYDNIVFTTTEWNSAIANSTYTNDTVYQQNMLNPTAPKALVGTVTNCPANVPTNACDPSYTTTGADHRSYRVDTYLYYDTPSYGNQLRTVTVVIRNPDDLTRTYSRVTSTFDPSIGG